MDGRGQTSHKWTSSRQDMQVGGKQAWRHLSGGEGVTQLPGRILIQEEPGEGVSPGTLQGGQVGALSGHLA